MNGKLQEEQLERLTDAAVRVAHPVKMVLFGSQARGTTDVHSDVDLLVITDRPFFSSRPRHRAIGDIRRALPRVGLPVDVLLFTEDEVERWQDTTNHVIARALREGRVLYERS